jgi:hypothetical protein
MVALAAARRDRKPTLSQQVLHSYHFEIMIVSPVFITA